MILDNIQLTESSDSLARVRLWIKPGGLPTDVTLAGALTGPRCRYARTLSAEFPVRNQNGTVELLVTEPCYWTADMPFLYDLSIEIRQAGTGIDTIEQTIGLRRLTVRGPHVFVEGKRFVFRAAHLRDGASIDWQAWRETRLAMYAVDPDQELCHAASEQGVWIIGELTAASRALSLMNYPAVAIVVLPGDAPVSMGRLPGGPLMGVRTAASGRDAESNIADVLVYDVADVATAKEALAGYSRPAIAVRSIDDFDTLVDARSACETLQRDLAPELNLAGYVV